MSLKLSHFDPPEDLLCANCGHPRSQHYHRKYSHSRGMCDVCHALIWKRGQQKECGCQGFVKKNDGRIWKGKS